MTTLTMNIQATITITAMTCPVCGVHYGLDEEFRKRALEAGQGKWQWYCTNGHQLGYHGQPEAVAKLTKELERAQERLESERGWSARLSGDLEHERKSHASTKGQLTKTRKRIGNGVCPDCNRHFTNVERHMATKHPTVAP